jgi:hypothetical protein
LLWSYESRYTNILLKDRDGDSDNIGNAQAGDYPDYIPFPKKVYEDE